MNSYSWYQDRIRDHYHNTPYKGVVEQPHVSGTSQNNSCGDRIHVTATIADGLLTAIKFDGEGCVISQAAASLLAEHVQHKDIKFIEGMTAADMQVLLGIPLGPVRLRCALLALEALHKGIKEYARPSAIDDAV